MCYNLNHKADHQKSFDTLEVIFYIIKFVRDLLAHQFYYWDL